MNITKRLSTTGALLLVFVFVSQVLFPIQADAAGSKSYATNDQIQAIDGYTICHLNNDGWCGITQFDGDNVTYEACAGLFFASPFWKKLQSKNGQPCMSQKDKVARIPGTHGAGMNPLQTGYLYQR